MTNQPNDCFRFFALLSTMIMTSLAAQGLGMISGSMLNIKFTIILGSFFICPFVLFSNFSIHMKDTEEIFHIFFELSFIKISFDGSMISIFGFQRQRMYCDKEYCHFQWPHKFLKFLQVNEDFNVVIVKLLIFTLVFRLVAFTILHFRLKR